MQSYRIGNDIPFRWPIYTGRDIDRVPFDLTGRKLTLEAISKTGKSYPIEMTTDGNIVQGTFYGKDQKVIGTYVIVLTENKDEVGMRTIDTCEFVNLVDRSYKATGGSNDVIHYDVLELSGSRVATYSGVVDSELSETSANPVENRVVTKALNEIGNKTAEGLDAKLDKEAVVQESGTGTDKVMSQKVVTELFEALTKALELKQEKLTAGRGISIEGGVISSTLDTNPFVVVSSLPATGNSEKIYLVPAEKQEEGNLTDEWIWNNGRWERLGSAKVDLTAYVKTEDVEYALGLKVDKVEGKELSSNDYTDTEKAKLAELQNYDDSEVRGLIAKKANTLHNHTVSQITDFPAIPSKTSELENDSGFITNIAPKTVEHGDGDTGTADVPFAIVPNVLHVWPVVSALYLELEESESSYMADEYMVQFTASSEGCTLALPDNIIWFGGTAPTINADRTYELSIINNLAVIGEFWHE